MTKPVLHVQMLGGFGLQIGSETVPSIPSRRATVLLAFLILNRDRPQTRDLLAGRIWPDLAEDTARRRLSHALWQIRTEVESVADESLLETTQLTVQLSQNYEVETDFQVFFRRLDEFEKRFQSDRRSVGIDDLDTIVESYGGDLLSGYYDDWIPEEQARVQERYAAAVAQLVQMNTSQGQYETALRHVRSLIAIEPLSEEWHRQVIRLYGLNGQPSAAERHFEAYCITLRDELHIEPPADTVKLVERIRRDAATPPPAFDSVDEQMMPLVGRATERSALLGRVNEVVSGKGGVILVEGEPGVGKSRLMEELAQGADWRDVQVLVGRHTPTSALSPYAGLKAALAPATIGLKGERVSTLINKVLLRQASTVLDGLTEFVEPEAGQALRPEEEPWRTTEALALVVMAQAKPKPTLLILEDVHWCDEDTMAVLVQLGDRLMDSSVLICLTYHRQEAQRSAAIWRGLTELEAKPGSSRLVVGPLAAGDVRDLVNSELGTGRMSEPAIERLTRTSAGNPYVVLELLRSPVELIDEELGSDELAGDGVGSHLPPRVRDIIGRRIESTTESVRLVLDGLAALGSSASSSTVTKLVDLDQAVVIGAIAEAIDLGFLIESSAKRCEFAQEQTRAAVYERVPIERRAALHGRIVDALVGDSTIGVEELAYHAWLAKQWQRAYQYHSLAAEAALKVNSYQTAAEHFAKADDAARSAGIGDGVRHDDLFAFEQVLEILGRRDDQGELLDRLAAIDNVDTPVRMATMERQAWLLANTDQPAEGASLAADAVDEARLAGHNVGELLRIVGFARLWSGDMPGAVEPLERSIEEFRRDGIPALGAQLMLGRIYANLQRDGEARLHLEDAYAQAQANNDARSQVEALGYLATLYDSQDNESEAELAFVKALGLATEIGYRHGEGLNLLNMAAFNVFRGRAGRALDLNNRAGVVFASMGNGRFEALVKLNGSELAHLILGDDVRARAEAEEAAVFFRSVGDEWHEASCLKTLASIDRRQGRRRMAKRRLTAALRKAIVSNDPLVVVPIQFNLALVDFNLDHPTDALVHIGTAQALVEQHGLDRWAPVLLALEAQANATLEELDRAVDLVNLAIPLNGPGAEQAHLAAWWSADVLSAAGRTVAAGEQVALAHQLLARNLDDLPEPIAAASWQLVPEHRAIAEAREQHFAEHWEIQLPGLDVPTGRPLEAGDHVDIVWTTSHPDDWIWSTPAARRRHRILRLTAQAVEQGAAARVSDLADVLDVSERTVKRDLATLRAEGHNPLTRGSAEEKI